MVNSRDNKNNIQYLKLVTNLPAKQNTFYLQALLNEIPVHHMLLLCSTLQLHITSYKTSYCGLHKMSGSAVFSCVQLSCLVFG